VYFIKVKRQRDLGVHSASFLAGVFLTSAIVATPWALLSSDDLGSLDVRDFAFVVLMIVGPGLIGHGMMTWTQRHLDITIASMLTLLHPVLSTVEAWLIYDERLDGLQFLGAAVVLVALGAIIREAREAVPEVQEALPVAAD
jgi:drug/metabolite transporter (DMT)-like permease